MLYIFRPIMCINLCPTGFASFSVLYAPQRLDFKDRFRFFTIIMFSHMFCILTSCIFRFTLKGVPSEYKYLARCDQMCFYCHHFRLLLVHPLEQLLRSHLGKMGGQVSLVLGAWAQIIIKWRWEGKFLSAANTSEKSETVWNATFYASDAAVADSAVKWIQLPPIRPV